MNLPPNVLKMICETVEVHGDPFAPWQSSTDMSIQETEWRCNGCKAIGVSKWPDWKLNMTHESGCGWVAWRDQVLTHGQ